MRLFTIVFLFFAFSFNLLAQLSKEDKEVQQTFRQNEMKSYMKGMNAKSTQGIKSDGSIDALYYEIKLNFDFVLLEINGEVTGRFRSKVNSLSQITLDFDDNMSVDSIKGNVTSFSHSGYDLTVNLAQTFNSNDVLEVTVFYHGSPNSSGFGSFSMTSSRAYTLSEPYGAKGWWPCKDTPNDKPDSVDIYLTVPSAYKAVSNGSLIDVTPGPNNTSVWHWNEKYPIATYLVSLAIASDYANFTDEYVSASGDTLLLDYYVYNYELSQAQTSYADVPKYLEAFEYYFGAYPFYEEKYGMARFGWGGGMEHQTITSIGSTSGSNGWRNIYIHELGHQWFGDLVTCANFHHIWLNESFASYSEPLYYEYWDGAAAYHSYMASQDHRPWYGTIYIQDTTSTGSIFGNIVYDKGSWVLHMLRHVVGDSVFFTILKSYTTDPRFAYGSATTEGFQTICEEISGQDLSAFFDQWIYHPSYPKYQYAWSVIPSGSKWLTKLVIKQTQTHHVYTMPIDITFQATGWDSTFVVLNDSDYQRYYIVTSTLPTNVLFDKDKWILRDVQQVVDSILDPADKPPVTYKLYQNFPNPFNPETTIAFYTPDKAEVEIRIYDINGREIKYLFFSSPNQGTHFINWNGTDSYGSQVSSGVYFYKL
ncbi:M1 family aminopeptidase, partial [Calditrichota bacterium]